MRVLTHETAFARDVADPIVFFDEGRIIETGDPQSFFVAPRTERARLFLTRFMS